jgi:hypothetical protein
MPVRGPVPLRERMAQLDAAPAIAIGGASAREWTLKSRKPNAAAIRRMPPI